MTFWQTNANLCLIQKVQVRAFIRYYFVQSQYFDSELVKYNLLHLYSDYIIAQFRLADRKWWALYLVVRQKESWMIHSAITILKLIS